MFPTEIWYNIGLSLDVRSLTRLGRSSKLLRLIFHSQQFWRIYTFHQAQNGNILNTLLLHELESQITSWFDFYRCASQQVTLSIHSYRGRREERIPIPFPRYTTDRVIVDYFGQAHLIGESYDDTIEVIPLSTKVTQVLWSGGIITRYVLYVHERKLSMYCHISNTLNLTNKIELASDVDDVSCTPLSPLSSCRGVFDLTLLYILLRRGNNLSQIMLTMNEVLFREVNFQEEPISYSFDLPWWSSWFWSLSFNLRQSTVRRYSRKSQCLLEYHICVTDSEHNLYSGLLRSNNEITFRRVETCMYLSNGCAFSSSVGVDDNALLLERKEKTHTNILLPGYCSEEYGLLFVHQQGKTYNVNDLVRAHRFRSHMYLSSMTK